MPLRVLVTLLVVPDTADGRSAAPLLADSVTLKVALLAAAPAALSVTPEPFQNVGSTDGSKRCKSRLPM